MTLPYATPEAFKQALETRIRRRALERRQDINRLRQLLLFDRFLARVGRHFGERVVVKGGVVLELRLDRARTTRDVDLRITGDAGTLLEELQATGRAEMGDDLTFEVIVAPANAAIDGPGVIYEGRRFRAQAELAGKVYGAPFGVDVAFGDPLFGTPDVIDGPDFLAFVGLPATRVRVYPRESHVAEKLHAYTLPRSSENSRVKDLPDLALLGQTGSFRAEELRIAIDRTFAFRGTHEVPKRVPAPPESWATPYERMASIDHLPWPDLQVVRAAVGAFLDPILSDATGIWSPSNWRWENT